MPLLSYSFPDFLIQFFEELKAFNLVLKELAQLVKEKLGLESTEGFLVQTSAIIALSCVLAAVFALAALAVFALKRF